jgi:hypothetical protein
MEAINENKPNIYWGGSISSSSKTDFTSRGHDGTTHLPHIMNTVAGRDRHDPMHRSIYEVYFTLPALVKAQFDGTEEATLTEQVTDVSGLDALQKTVLAGSQKFFGVDVSFLNPTLDNTYAEFTINFNLNIRSVTDAWVLRVFKYWEKLGYDLADGTRTLKADYIADNMRIAEANRDGSIFRAYVFHDIMITNVTGLDSLNYTDNEPAKLSVTFRSDYWDEDMSTGNSSN